MKHKMAYTHDGYTLFVKHITLKNKPDTTYPMYFFSKKLPKSGEPCDLPEGYTVGKNEKTGFLYLKKRK